MTRVARRVYVMDNGGVPFVVELSSRAAQGGGAPGTARVLRLRGGEHSDADPRDASRQDELYEPWREFRYVRAWVGLDPAERRKKRGLLGRLLLFGGPSAWHGGSAVLLELGNRQLVVVGDTILQFTLPAGESVVDFVSVMGNSGVPYPYIVGTSNTYLTGENVFLPNSALVPAAGEEGEGGRDPYDFFYSSDPATGRAIKHMPTQQKAAKAFASEHRLPGLRELHERHEPWGG